MTESITTIKPSEIGKIFLADLCVAANVGSVISALAAEAEKRGGRPASLKAAAIP